MQTLIKTLATYDLELLRIIANRWDADLAGRDAPKAAEQLADAMLRPEKITEVWSRLPDDQRGGLQALSGAGGKMPVLIFQRMFGEIRQMGPDRLVREKPHLNPASVAEGLYFRGLVALSYSEDKKSGQRVQAVVYIPTDLRPLLPTHLTGFALNPEKPAEAPPPAPEPENIRLADTMLVDDLATLLAACQVEDIKLTEGALPADIRTGLKVYFLGSNSPARLALMIALAVDMGIMSASDETVGFLKPIAQSARTWLDAPRPSQVRALAETWQRSVSYNELRFTPGLKVERAQNDPLLLRQTITGSLELVPPNGWWPAEELVEAIKESEADFQRPDGDYDSWYIRDAQTGAYLRGFDSWDKVDGAALRFTLIGPMHGLGLLDLAADGAVCRLTAYGRALFGMGEWPQPAPNTEGSKVKIAADGLCLVPRTVSRYERFQLARFTDWIKAADPFEYRLSADGMARARKQGIRPEQVLTFLRRIADEGVPEPLVRQIDLWAQAGQEGATLSRMIVLRLPREDMLDTMMNTPALRRYLAAPLGPAAVAVRPNQWEALVRALKDNGIAVEVDLDS